MKRHSKHNTERLFIALGLLMLVGCGGQTTHPPPSTRTSPTAASTSLPTPTPVISRVPYPWPMQPVTTVLGTTVYQPADPRVRVEMRGDFLTYWTWSGHKPPAVIQHFVPDATQIPSLATAAYAASLQAYVQQVQTSARLVSYVGAQFIQNVNECSKDGLQCMSLYALGRTVKTVYSTTTGSILSQTGGSNLEVYVTVLQVYNRELQRWQIGALDIHEDAL